MWKKKRFTCSGVFLIFLVSFISAGYAEELESMKFSTGTFININRLDTDLQRGVSTKIDVQRVLGAPKGMGVQSYLLIVCNESSGTTRTSK